MPFTVEARDDLQLVEAGWRLDRQQRSGEPAPVSLTQSARAVGGTDSRIEATLDMPNLQVRTGDTLLLRGTALDGMEAAGTPRGIVLSEPRRIRVVDAPTLERQVRQQAEGLRQVVTRLEQAQDEVSRDMDARSQTALGERIRQARTAAAQLTDRMARNGLEDQPLTECFVRPGMPVPRPVRRPTPPPTLCASWHRETQPPDRGAGGPGGRQAGVASDGRGTRAR